MQAEESEAERTVPQADESVEDNKITKFLYDGLNAVIERDWNNTTQARYIYAADNGADMMNMSLGGE